MDNFMDKIAQKLNSQEVIRANSAADAAQIEKLQEQVREYDACMKEMRKLNLKNVENEQKIQELLIKNEECVQKLFDECSMGMQQITQECLTKMQTVNSKSEKAAQIEEALEDMRKLSAANMNKIDELFKQSDDYVHKENVKVYRNVQAVVVEEMEKQAQVLLNMGHASALAVKNKNVFVVSIITLIVSMINMGLLIVHLTGIM